MAEQTRLVHALDPPAAWMAAQLVAATALLSVHIKGEERLALQLQASSPRCAFYGEIGGDGTFRARFSPSVVPPRAVMSGILVAIKSANGREVYRGSSAVEGETVEAALQRYLVSSVQIGAAIRLGAVWEDDGSIGFAGGVLVERLPEEPGLPSISADEFAERAARLTAGNVDELVYGVIGGELGDERVEVLEDNTIVWQCRCSRERVEQTLIALGGNEIRSILAEQGKAEVSCHFCNRNEVIEGPRLEELLAGLVEA